MLEKFTFFIFLKKLSASIFKYFYSNTGTPWAIIGTSFSQVPATIQKRMFLFNKYG